MSALTLLPDETIGSKLRNKLAAIRLNAESACHANDRDDLHADMRDIIAAVDEAVPWTEQSDREGAVLEGLRLRCEDQERRIASLEQALEQLRVGAPAAGGGSLLEGAEAPTNASAPGPRCRRCDDTGVVMTGRTNDPAATKKPCHWCRKCEDCDGEGRVDHDSDHPNGLRCSKCKGTGAQTEQRRFCSEGCGDVAEAGRSMCAECRRGDSPISDSLGGF